MVEAEYQTVVATSATGRIVLAMACFLAMAFAAAMLVGNYEYQQRLIDTVTSERSTVEIGTQILTQQQLTRADVAELKRALIRPKGPSAPLPGSVPTPQAAPPAQPDAAPAPTTPQVPDDGTLGRLDNYLSRLQEQVLGVQRAVDERVPLSRDSDLAGRFVALNQSVVNARRLLASARGVQPQKLSAPTGLDSCCEPPARFIRANANVAVQPVPAPTTITIPVVAGGPTPANLAWTKLYIMFGIFGALALTFLVAVIAIFTSSNPAAISFATDTMKTLLGFFIGVATAFMGG